MPCPFFEPQALAADPAHPNARLPLLDEYDGVCRAAAEAFRVPRDLRFPCCNHGYSRGSCSRFPASETRSSIRFDVLSANRESLELLFVEERDHFPLNWRSVRYIVGTESIDPGLDDGCARAQILAFCKSYLRRFPG
jgi:hypothetical protein